MEMPKQLVFSETRGIVSYRNSHGIITEKRPCNWATKRSLMTLERASSIECRVRSRV